MSETAVRSSALLNVCMCVRASFKYRARRRYEKSLEQRVFVMHMNIRESQRESQHLVLYICDRFVCSGTLLCAYMHKVVVIRTKQFLYSF